jgi:hypothetical protein
VDGGSIPAGLELNEERAAVIRQAILEARPPYAMTDWLAKVASMGISPAEGMAYLLALLGDGRRFAMTHDSADNALIVP